MSDGTASTELLAAAKDAAARNTDYYALLALAPDDPLTRDSVQRAWRKRSLKYHPDKAGADFDAAKWEEFGLARDILASDEARAAYDAARSALLQKQRERDLMNAKQRRFAEELEKAEAASGSVSSKGGAREQQQQEAKNADEEREKERQAAEGRRYMDERKRKLREAEERERERARKEDEDRDDRIRELEGQIAEKARRRAEKRAKREARKSGAGVASVVVDEDDVAKLTRPATTTTKPSPDAAAAAATPPPPEAKPIATDPHKPVAPTSATPVPMADVKMSDDPIQFWETQWPKTKARLLAAQATKEKRRKETQAAA